MHVHILGICGTFMGGLALLARALGHRVSGSDADVYPPMSTQLEAAGIELIRGYDQDPLEPAPDCVVVGNALSRGNPALERMLERGLWYTSGPQWLAEHVLRGRSVLAVAGTHGKTTTSSLLAWILDAAGLEPGFLIGGVPGGFGVSARLGRAPWFVIEADEYDTAFFDKRSKFVHYRPRIAVLHNLEFDHADIFPDLGAIERQFHHLVRTIPGNGRILVNARDANLGRVLEMGCWTPVIRYAAPAAEEAAGVTWEARDIAPDGSRFAVYRDGAAQAEVAWPLLGRHNVENALAALAAAVEAGVPAAQAAAALGRFPGVRRRLELLGEVGGVRVYDDFAHHPTAIAATLQGLRARIGTGAGRILAVIEPRSNTMRMGVHRDALAQSVADADRVWWYRPPGLDWDLEAAARAAGVPAEVHAELDAIVESVCAQAAPGDHVVIMSNGGFGGIHRRLLEALAAAPA